MKAKSSLVRSDRAVELYAVPCIYMYLSVIIHPRNTELKLSLRLCQSFKKSFFTEFLFICLDNYTKRLKDFFYCLVEFRLCRVFLYDQIDHFINV